MAAVDRRCAACGKTGATARCGRCKAAYFCGAECQRDAYSSRRHYGCSAPPAPTLLSAASPAGFAPTPAKAADTTAILAKESLTHLAQLIRRVAGGGSPATAGHSHSAADHLPPGTLRELLRPGAFLQHAFPGVNPADLSPECPRSLAQLFEMPSLQEARAAAALRAVERGRAVLASVKAKGAAAGQMMDADTERSLWPQVFGEAFARELQAIVAVASAGEAPGLAAGHATGTGGGRAETTKSAGSAGGLSASAPSSSSSASADDVASPFHVLSASNYVRESSLAALFAKPAPAPAPAPDAASGAAPAKAAAAVNELATPPGVALQAGPFLDEDADAWRRLALDDCARMAEEPQRWSAPLTAEGAATATIVYPEPPSGAGASHDGPAAARLSLRGASSSSYAWLNDAEAEGEFPALSEVLQRLHALPYELNRKVPGLLLHKPKPGTALLRRVSVTLTWKLAPTTAAPSATAVGVAGIKGKVLFLGSRSGAVAHDKDGEDEEVEEVVLDMPMLPHGETLLPHAPGATSSASTAAGGAGVAAGESGPVLLTVVYAAGRTTSVLPGEAASAGERASSDGDASAGSSPAISVKASARLLSDFEGTAAPASVDLTAGNQLLLHRTRDVRTRPSLRCKLTVTVPKRRAPATTGEEDGSASVAAPGESTAAASSSSQWPKSALTGAVRIDIFTVCAYVRGPVDSALLPPAPASGR